MSRVINEMRDKAAVYANSVFGILYHEHVMPERLSVYTAFLRGMKEMCKWKSVEKDGYPEKNVGVLVFIPDEDNHITSGMWDVSEKWVLLDEYRKPECEVTHWMPLPPIPKNIKP